ncbi:PAS domain S-box [Burkholderia sp. Ch1-1]|uniref:histidine kinase n=1 Tax=Paraburkholderia dioscoreae TaxID=2604047 RepID=A0A5Q4ZNW8_9BURK|nr:MULTISPECIES: PAS domain-containing sensor histidine kinase [Paraburkholderia]EIF33547.1 PAS domain S-box [Burkholderia sp. Ch1-1]MDR8395682.1 PAS domain S-box protein [Paraburkholderia sp. USG1]VVD32408.1 PAS domain S-box [Paraburkholderia dioscoreae]
MENSQRASATAPRDAGFLPVLAALIALAVFLIDALTPLDVAVAVFYVIVVLLVASSGNRSFTIAAAWGCVALTLLGFLISHAESWPGGAVARCVVSLLAIATTSVLALRNQAATTMLQEQVELLNLTHDAIIVHDMNDRITFWNHGAQALYGWSAQQALGQSIDDLTQTSFPVPYDEVRGELLRTNYWHGELRRVRHDGSAVVISSRAALWRDAKGDPRAVLVTNNDITARKEMEAELERQQQELRATIDAIPGMVWHSSSDGRLTFINRRWNDMGVTLGDDVDVWSTVVHPSDLPRMQRDWQAAIAAGVAFENVSRLRTSAGVYRWMHIGAEPLRDAGGAIRRWYGVNTDIEERKQAEQALERSEAFLLDAQRLSRTGSMAVRFPEGMMWWSDESYRIFGYTREVEPSVKAILARTHPDDLALVRRVYERAAAGEPQIDVEHRLVMPDGGVKYLHCVAHAAASKSAAGEYVGALMDITDTRLAQDALARSTAELAHVTRVTMLGELAASIAHEVTQPIAAIMTCGGAALRWMDRAPPDLNAAAKSVTQIVRDAQRADAVIQRIRSMAKKCDRIPVKVDLNGIVGETVELLRYELDRYRVDVQIDLATPSPTAYCDRVQLQQVIINLIMNGAQAMTEVPQPRRLRIATRRFDAEQAHLIVQDSGTGISEENASRLFDTFFTTKAGGIGMGLSICRSIVEAHGGRIWAESPEAGGAVVQFILPVDEGRSHEQSYA